MHTHPARRSSGARRSPILRVPGVIPALLVDVPDRPVRDAIQEYGTLQQRVESHINSDFPRRVITLSGPIAGTVRLPKGVRLRLIGTGPVTVLSAEGDNEIYYEGGASLTVFAAVDTDIIVTDTAVVDILDATDCKIEIGNLPARWRHIIGHLLSGNVFRSAVGEFTGRRRRRHV